MTKNTKAPKTATQLALLGQIALVKSKNSVAMTILRKLEGYCSEDQDEILNLVMDSINRVRNDDSAPENNHTAPAQLD